MPSHVCIFLQRGLNNNSRKILQPNPKVDTFSGPSCWGYTHCGNHTLLNIVFKVAVFVLVDFVTRVLSKHTRDKAEPTHRSAQRKRAALACRSSQVPGRAGPQRWVLYPVLAGSGSLEPAAEVKAGPRWQKKEEKKRDKLWRFAARRPCVLDPYPVFRRPTAGKLKIYTGAVRKTARTAGGKSCVARGAVETKEAIAGVFRQRRLFVSSVADKGRPSAHTLAVARGIPEKTCLQAEVQYEAFVLRPGARRGAAGAGETR